MAQRQRENDPLAHLQSEGPRPVYGVDGEERILVDEAVELIRTSALAGGSPDFNQDVFTAKSTPVSRIVEAAQTLPAFARARVVLVKDMERLGAEDAEPLCAYLSSPSPTTVLILVAEKFDARTRFYKAVQKAGTTLRFPRPKERDMPALIRARAKRAGAAIEEGAIRLLVEAVGTDLGQAVAALEKLSLYAGGEGTRITSAHVEELISHGREESIFAFADAVSTQDTSLALSTLHAMLSGNRGHPLGLVGMLAKHWRRLTRARSLLDAGASRAEVQAGFEVPPFVASKLLGQAESQNLDRLVAGLSAIARADRALKGGKLANERVMERLVLTLTER